MYFKLYIQYTHKKKRFFDMEIGMGIISPETYAGIVARRKRKHRGIEPLTQLAQTPPPVNAKNLEAQDDGTSPTPNLISYLTPPIPEFSAKSKSPRNKKYSSAPPVHSNNSNNNIFMKQSTPQNTHSKSRYSKKNKSSSTSPVNPKAMNLTQYAFPLEHINNNKSNK
eukprot:427357_1